MHFQNAFDERAPNLGSIRCNKAERSFPDAGQVGSAPLVDPASTTVPGGLAPWQIKRVSAHVEANLSEALPR